MLANKPRSVRMPADNANERLTVVDENGNKRPLSKKERQAVHALMQERGAFTKT